MLVLHLGGKLTSLAKLPTADKCLGGPLGLVFSEYLPELLLYLIHPHPKSAGLTGQKLRWHSKEVPACSPPDEPANLLTGGQIKLLLTLCALRTK